MGRREHVLSQAKGRDAPKKAPVVPLTPRKNDEPGWAGGLRQLYNSVVDEPLPDSFKDLLKKLDDTADG